MKLKNETIYFNKILTYCEAVGIQVYFKPKLNNAYYLSKIKKIYIDPKYKGSNLIAILLHEIGHFEDDTITNKMLDKLYDRASKKIDKEKRITQAEFDCVMKCETNAWKHGMLVAKKLKIPLGKWYNKFMEQALITYYEVPVYKNVVK